LFQSILDSTSKTADFQQGKDLLEQSHKVVENYIKQKTKVDIKQQIVKLMGESTDAYSHAQSVSTLVCLFSMAFEIGTPEDLAIAGLFHDIGIVGISTEVTPFDYKEKLSPEDQKKYEFHPENSLNLLKEKRITVSPKISEIIEKHHERSDGKGFPKNLPPHKVPLEAQLLRFADLFEYCTRVSAGEKRLSPLEAVEKLNHIGGFSPEIISKARKFFSEVTANAA
jgi:HD-GYP domain-containing protein (c-di-GMP phosphodiesterase class II)